MNCPECKKISITVREHKRLKAIEGAARALHSASAVREGGYIGAGEKVLVDLERALYPVPKGDAP